MVMLHFIAIFLKWLAKVIFLFEWKVKQAHFNKCYKMPMVFAELNTYGASSEARVIICTMRMKSLEKHHRSHGRIFKTNEKENITYMRTNYNYYYLYYDSTYKLPLRIRAPYTQ
ncbi:argininosuccinate synthase [Platysternon megacephalum]|uniref:Argininosuccinate synthase n=1 Tax=Platysternon megacephalum TaxID=55544 RepID=A0A4D9DDR2_9SAUR|nr:argininosuccinate synthase [Platysternon megacephalum]